MSCRSRKSISGNQSQTAVLEDALLGLRMPALSRKSHYANVCFRENQLSGAGP